MGPSFLWEHPVCLAVTSRPTRRKWGLTPSISPREEEEESEEHEPKLHPPPPPPPPPSSSSSLIWRLWLGVNVDVKIVWLEFPSGAEERKDLLAKKKNRLHFATLEDLKRKDVEIFKMLRRYMQK